MSSLYWHLVIFWWTGLFQPLLENHPEFAGTEGIETYPHPWLAWTSIGKSPNHQSWRWDISQENWNLFSWAILLFMILIDFEITNSKEILHEITKCELAWKDWGFLQKSKYRWIAAPDCGLGLLNRDLAKAKLKNLCQAAHSI